MASLDIEVADRDLAGLVLQVQRPAAVSGRIAFAGHAAPPPELIARLQARAEPLPRSFTDITRLRTAGVDGEGRFTIADVSPGRYELSSILQGESGWFLQSVVVSGREMMNRSIDLRPGEAVSGVELVYDDRVAELTGTVLDAAGEPASQAMVLLYTSDERDRRPGSNRLRVSRPELDGRYTMSGMLPGDYRLAVVWDYEFGAWFDTAFLRAADRSAISITIGDRERKSYDLRAGNPP
jgi:hypothetical protein